jgi:hypothetical protein
MLVIPANLESLSTLKDGTIKLVFETQELSAETVGNLFACRNKLGYMAFKPELFEDAEVDIVANLKTSDIDNAKTPSKRMRNTLYMLWKENKAGYDDFQLYYNYRMEHIITMLKNEFER